MVEAVVEFDYVAQEHDELTIRKGDVISNIKTQPGGWWEGTLNGKRGMFPDNFVKVISDPDGTYVTLRPVSGRRCKVLFSYNPANEDELRLQVDDEIDILAEVEEGWWKGRLGDTIGVFPSNFVTEIEDTRVAGARKPRTSSREEASESDGELSTSVSSPDSSQVLDSGGKSEHDSDAPVLPPKPVKEICKVLYPYEAANEDELTLKEGDLITLLSREVADKGWWRGELRGKIGVFPDNFVEVIQQDETHLKKPERPPAKSQVTTNRARDSITKPAVVGSSAGASKVETASHRKSLDPPPKADDRPSTAGSSGPPLPGKKPSLPPPPTKKPHRVGSSSLLSTQLGKRDAPPPEQRLADIVDGAGPSRSAQSAAPRGLLEFDSIERSAMLTHPTATRVKAPRRRPPSQVFNKENQESVNSGLMNGSAETARSPMENHIAEEEGEEEGAERSRGRVWERGKAPWVEELKLNQAKKTSGLSSASSAASASTASAQSPPEQAERKLSKIKVEQPSPETKQQPVTMRIHASRPQSMFHDSSTRVTPHTRPLSSASPPDPSRLLAEVSQSRAKPLGGGSSTSPVLAGFHVKQEQTSPTVRPANSTSSSTSPVLASLLAKQPLDSTSPSSMSDPDLLASPTPRSPGLTGGISVTYKQFTELKDKVSKLEHTLESQREMFTKMIADLTVKLNDEMDKRIQLEQAMDKLTNLVTQV